MRASLYHELAAVLGALILFALTYGKPNAVALWTYLIFWWMHQSAKLNVFLGVPNHGEEMLPDHLAYLTSFMRCRPMNFFFPVSVTVSTVATMLLWQWAYSASASPFEVVGGTMLAALMTLSVARQSVVFL